MRWKPWDHGCLGDSKQRSASLQHGVGSLKRLGVNKSTVSQRWMQCSWLCVCGHRKNWSNIVQWEDAKIGLAAVEHGAVVMAWNRLIGACLQIDSSLQPMVEGFPLSVSIYTVLQLYYWLEMADWIETVDWNLWRWTHHHGTVIPVLRRPSRLCPIIIQYIYIPIYIPWNHHSIITFDANRSHDITLVDR